MLTVAASLLCTLDPPAATAVAAPPDRAAGTEAVPQFRWRGVVEGYYGTPWTHAEREAQFTWMGAHGLNAYIHAPKDDPYQRANWRDPYPAAEEAALLHEVEAASAAGVGWIPNISPAFALIPSRPAPGTAASRPICFACSADVDVLVQKLAPFVAAGAPAVAISFDDVLPVSPYPQDWRTYGVGAVAAARMQRDLLASVRERLGVAVITVLTEYAGTHDSPYLQAIRSGTGLDPGVEVCWTGTAVISATITAGDAAAYARLVGRDRIVVWDNYPAHDVTGPVFGRPPSRLFLGPYEGRDPRLGEAVDGIVSDPMQFPVASRIALSTMGEYLADPAGYDPEAAWERALDDAGGGGVAVLAQNSRSSRLDRTESLQYSAAAEAFEAGLAAGGWPAARVALDAQLAREMSAGAEVAAANPALFGEIEPWLSTLAANAAVTSHAADLAQLLQPDLAVSTRGDGSGGMVVTGTVAPARPADAVAGLPGLASEWAALRARPPVTHGDRLTFLSDIIYVGENRMDRFVGGITWWVLSRLVPAAVAGTRVSVAVDGVGVTVAADGTFATTVAVGPVEVVATDGAGAVTRVRTAG